ncbi:glycosyltransferase [Motiliproteus coralliicola]|uniref:glycosyltransferase n=1 Tax=Motiliproteus coralliicola TaxID=2283196 RepID=UPI001A9E9496|nr:glycosyltransferase [Motiliproteus coralliicola]
MLSTLFPSPARPKAGLFIRERMFRVNRQTPLIVLSPVPWFPGQSLIRLVKPDYRPTPPYTEVQQGIRVFYPRFLALPYFFRTFDAWMIAHSCRRLIHREQLGHIRLIDSHFGYPDGLAATLLGRWLNKPVTITLRGTEVRHSQSAKLRPKLKAALTNASRVFSVSNSLRRLALELGIDDQKLEVVGNGVDSEKFFPLDKQQCREQLAIPPQAPVLITVGGIVERKGFHRVIECLPSLIKQHPDLIYLVVGGANPEGNFKPQLDKQIKRLGLGNHVRFLGERKPEELKQVLSAADTFVLASSNEGWANVILEAMACGLPVIATDVGGNAEVVSSGSLGAIVPFGDTEALTTALDNALRQLWNQGAIINYAKENSWDSRIAQLHQAFDQLMETG